MRVRHKPQICDDVLDLLTVVKPGSAHDLVRDIRVHQLVFQNARLGMDPVEHDLIRETTPLPLEFQDIPNHILGFRGFIVRVIKLDFRPALFLSPKRLGLAPSIVLDQMICRIKNHGRRAVILFHADRPGFRIIRLKIQDIFDIGPAPRVNGLVRIPDHGDLTPRRSKKLHKTVLRVVRVLVFVDQNVLETVLPGLKNRRHSVKKCDGLHDQIAEITCLEFFHLLFVEFVDLSHGILIKVLGLFGILKRRQEIILRTLDLLAHAFGMDFFFIKTELFDAVLDDLQLVVFVVDDEVGLDLDRGAVVAENTKAGGMESAHPNPLGDKLFDAVAHFGRGLIRKGHAENMERQNALLDEPRNTMREDARFPAPRPGKNQKRPLRHPRYRFPLRRIQTLCE